MNERLLMICVMIALSGGCAFSCSGGGEKVGAGLESVHDDERGVTCWRSNFRSGNEVSVAFSCLPDSALSNTKDAGR